LKLKMNLDGQEWLKQVESEDHSRQKRSSDRTPLSSNSDQHLEQTSYMATTCPHSKLTKTKPAKLTNAKIKVQHSIPCVQRLTLLVEDVHYDPNAEVRSRGVGHYTFSADNKSRAAQMAALNEAKDETERQRTAAQKAAEARRAKIEERRKEIAGKKRKREAEKFLSGLELDMGSPNSV